MVLPRHLPPASYQLAPLEGIFEATHRLIYGAKDDSGQRYRLVWTQCPCRSRARYGPCRSFNTGDHASWGWTNVNIVMNYIRNLDSETGAMVRLLEDGD